MIKNVTVFSEKLEPETPHSMFALNLGISEIISVKKSCMANKAIIMFAHRDPLHI
jgi:hypothetical protein